MVFSERLRRARARLLSVVLMLGALFVALPQTPASAEYTAFCTGYTPCKDAGYSHFGYATANSTSWWNMYTGHNCTNYVAYRLVKAGLPNVRPWSGSGNAANWGLAMASITDSTPMVGSVAWWGAYVWPAAGSGHVAYVQRVVSDSEIWISEDSWSGDFHWRRVTKTGSGWPSGFIHFQDKALAMTSAPTLSTQPKVDVPVTVQPGTWTPAATSYTYQWLQDGVPIPNATTDTYTPGPGRVGKQLTVQVTAMRLGYVSTVATTEVGAPIAPGDLTPGEAPVVSGDTIVGGTLTATPATWTPAATSSTVQWLANGVPIPNATGWTLQLAGEQANATITAAVTGVRAGYNPSTIVSAPTAPVLAGTVTLTTEPALTGTPLIGERLRVTAPTYEPSTASVSYVWLRDGAKIAGASNPSYKLVAEDVGSVISVRVKIGATGYRGVVVTTAATERVRTLPRFKVTATGGEGRATIRVTVTAPGVSTVRGDVTIKVGLRMRTVTLVNGQAEVVIRQLSAGERPVVIRYPGVGLVDPGVYRGSVLIL